RDSRDCIIRCAKSAVSAKLSLRMKILEDITLAQVARVINATINNQPHSSSETSILDVTHDSRQVRPGSLFVAVRGELFDAHKFIPQVMQHGAVGVISEQPAPNNFQGAWLQVENVRRAMALAAAEVQRHPSGELHLVGITGTNGKTTTAYLVASIP